MTAVFYHNPSCSKSRQSLALLNAQNVELEVIEYLKTPPTQQQLDHILRGLNMQPRDLIRKDEVEYQQFNLSDPNLSRGQLIEIMVQNPKLIQRPILVVDDLVAIGRPPEALLELLASNQEHTRNTNER